MISRTALLRSTVALAAVAVTAVTLSGCSAPAGSTTNTNAAKDPTSLTLALVPSQDQAGLVDLRNAPPPRKPT